MNPRLRLNGPLAWSAATLLAIVVLAVVTLPALARAALGPDLSGEGVEDVFARLMEEHGEVSEDYRDRFDGRSVFFKPPRKRKYTPPPPPREKPKTIVKDNTPPPPPPPPQRPDYSGPSLGGMIGDRVYFNGDLRVNVGEEIDGIRVISVNPPWGATVEHRGWEYELPLFEHGGFFETDEEPSKSNLGGFIEGDDKEEEKTLDGTARVDDEAAAARAASSGSSKPRGRTRATPRGAGAKDE